MARKTPDWFYPDELELEVPFGAIICITPHHTDDVDAELLIETDDSHNTTVAAVGYREVREMRNFFNKWIEWAEMMGHDS